MRPTKLLPASLLGLASLGLGLLQNAPSTVASAQAELAASPTRTSAALTAVPSPTRSARRVAPGSPRSKRTRQAPVVNERGARPAPTPAATATPRATPSPSPTPSPVASGCSGTLQALVDAAPAGSTVKVPACVYRETVTIAKSLTLDGQGKAEIRGSDVWSTGWTSSGGYWIHPGVPTFRVHGQCAAGTSRCLWPEQVFFDGKPLVQIAGSPSSGQFAVDGSRSLILRDNPAGHTVEVTTRTRWVLTKANNVTIQGFTLKHAANDSQSGAIENGSRSGWTLKDNRLSDAHGAIVSIFDEAGVKIVNNDISRAGQLGINGWMTKGALIQGNRIYDNNTEQFDPYWEAGGVKLAADVDPLVDGNEAFGNAGVGLWCDLDCSGAVLTNNRVHDNKLSGIVYEISRQGKIANNVVWQNGLGGGQGWGMEGGITCSCSSTEIAGNTLVGNVNGVVLISQDRGPSYLTVNIAVHDNQIIQGASASGSGGLVWRQNWNGPLFDPTANNRGWNNTYAFAGAEGSNYRFAWGNQLRLLSEFNATPGEEGGRYLTVAEVDRVLTAAGLTSMLAATLGQP